MRVAFTRRERHEVVAAPPAVATTNAVRIDQVPIADAKEPEIAYADEPCARCGGQIPEKDEVITRGHSWHMACADEVFGE